MQLHAQLRILITCTFTSSPPGVTAEVNGKTVVVAHDYNAPARSTSPSDGEGALSTDAVRV